MRIVTIDSKVLCKYAVDSEMLQKASRPCVLILKLTYRGRRYDFAIPMRSNINPSTPKILYFALPPRKTTKPGYRHGIHYAKMFPIDRSMVIHFRTDGNPEATRIKQIIDKNEKRIITECTNYLSSYEHGNRPKYCTDIDLLIQTLKGTDRK